MYGTLLSASVTSLHFCWPLPFLLPGRNETSLSSFLAFEKAKKWKVVWNLTTKVVGYSEDAVAYSLISYLRFQKLGSRRGTYYMA